MWYQPKVNWRAIDYYNIEDWQRVRNNLEHVCGWVRNNGLGTVALLPTDIPRGNEGLPYVHLINNMEENLSELQKIFGVEFTEDVSQKTWYDRLSIMYKSNPTYTDWNRWETILLRVYESIQYIDSYVFTPISGACYCGSERTLLRFSKGR